MLTINQGDPKQPRKGRTGCLWRGLCIPICVCVCDMLLFTCFGGLRDPWSTHLGRAKSRGHSQVHFGPETPVAGRVFSTRGCQQRFSFLFLPFKDSPRKGLTRCPKKVSTEVPTQVARLHMFCITVTFHTLCVLPASLLQLRWAKSRDSYRRIASESCRCDSNR